MRKIIVFILAVLLSGYTWAQPEPRHDLQFDSLASVWDEAIPLGNGTVGALIWHKADRLRFSLDRADLWDMRPMKGLHRKEFSYKWIYDQVMKKDYDIVQQYFDMPYDKEPAPSKIPGAALEFSIPGAPKVKSVRLSLENALCEVQWENGMILKTFVHATEPSGWFRFENISDEPIPELIAPPYEEAVVQGEVNSLVGDQLVRLQYKQGSIDQQGNNIVYRQEGWGGFKYEVAVQWKRINATTIEGAWSISSQYPGKKINPTASAVVSNTRQRGYDKDYAIHLNWWKNFWSRSTIHVPDTLLEKQWYLEQYKFGAAARKGAPPISLQAVWTADNGRIPPWKGDFHHDLNTQLSYWPSYSGNHLEEALGYLDHLDDNKQNYKRFTKLYYGMEGLAVPGVTTLDGTEMGGWTQYSLSPTVSSWLGQHYYLQWRYSMDRIFLKNRAYPWIKDVCVFLEHITVKDEKGYRKLPISSSPEINNNSIDAWFKQNTNYDLALMKFSFHAAAELAGELGLTKEMEHWKKISAEFGPWALSANNELMFAPTKAYDESHRHFSHLMAIHPLGLLKWEDGEEARSIIKQTISLLDKIGSENWCGYSFSWLANLKARAKDGDGAAKSLTIFAKAFCLPNSFHANGDQTKSGYSSFTYRPFTLEGNFAFAAGLQEMLLQSYAGFIEILPAIPPSWKDISFQNLRAEGAFLVNARKLNGKIMEVKIIAEKGGQAKLKLPFSKWEATSKDKAIVLKEENGFVSISFSPGGSIVISNTGE